MKKAVCILFILILIVCLCSCSEQTVGSKSGSNAKTVKDILDGEKTQETVVSENQDFVPDGDFSGEKCDVDLTVMTSTMVYAEVSNIMTNPEEYLGKTVKMKGNFGVYETDARNYYACIIADATACCSQGIEFVLKNERKYPEEYPEIGKEITVIGEFETYFEGDNKYCQLSNARISD